MTRIYQYQLLERVWPGLIVEENNLPVRGVRTAQGAAAGRHRHRRWPRLSLCAGAGESRGATAYMNGRR
jgi:hypothetical protein